MKFEGEGLLEGARSGIWIGLCKLFLSFDSFADARSLETLLGVDDADVATICSCILKCKASLRSSSSSSDMSVGKASLCKLEGNGSNRLDRSIIGEGSSSDTSGEPRSIMRDAAA